MPETPFEPFYGRRGDVRPWQRSFRCSSARVRQPAPMARYREFVELHESLSASPEVTTRRIWLRGMGTAALAVSVAVAGILIGRAVAGPGVPVILPSSAGTGDAVFTYAVCSGAATVQATALLHVLTAVAERPVRAFVSIAMAALAVATLLPLTLAVPAGPALVTAAVHLAGGAAIVLPLARVAAPTGRL
ncbi:DUF6069 family protein [Spirillospora sp. CA-294931]|uniref:DUF6069 family protein n=1 Tax=Spirillospora sp. CA-294931 TaxID=3240042 RepID=UPI003D9323CC